MSASNGLVIAVDGPAGSGKSSVCRGVAAELGMRYLDTGAMYRAMTVAVLAAGVDLSDEAAVMAVAEQTVITSRTDPSDPGIWLGVEDVADSIRGSDVTAGVSAVSAVPGVRHRLVGIQRSQVQAARDAGIGIVVEGRDIGTVVLPDADLKVFLIADPAVRAHRRALESSPGRPPEQESVAATHKALLERDAYDSGREISPLVQAPDAQVVDATHFTLAEVIEQVCALAAGVQR
ncbi:MAG: (d)CMP kinase [Candidatus Nanopelagicales bacterium]|nr:(d)CMP kinase [Candidatus Nanopelagicales bacterium]